MSSRVNGLTEVYSLFASLPDMVKLDLKPRLQKIGESAIKLQQAAVPHKTGNLSGSLTVTEELQNLRVKAGLVKLKKGNTSDRGNYYGVFVEYGRHAGTKMVQRRRRVDGKLRLGPGRKKRNEDIATSYMAKWGALPARPFVHQESRIISFVDAIMAGFWEQVIPPS